MSSLSPASQITGYVLMAIIGLYTLLLWWWQAMVLSGRVMKNPDGSTDDWAVQKTHYGMAFADVFLACPASLIGIALVFIAPRWGCFVLSLIAFWLVWVNLATTATSLRFKRPKITLAWLATFPSGSLLGAAYLVWVATHFEAVFGAPPG